MTRPATLTRALLAGVAVVSAAVFVVLTIYYEATAASLEDALSGFWWDGWLGFAIVGGVLVYRKPQQPIGRLLTAIAFFIVLTIAGAGYANHDYGADRRLAPLGTLAALTFYPALAAGLSCTMATVLTFPSGHLDTRLRRVGGWLIRVALTLTAVGYLVRPRLQLGERKWVHNPLHPAGLGSAGEAALAVGIVGLLAGAAVSLVSAVVTFRRSTGDERQQMRWFARSATVLPVLFLLNIAVEPFSAAASNWVVFAGIVLGLNAIAVAIGVAVSRYALYDIDRVVSRTVSYALVTGTIVAGYVGVVALTESVLGFSSGLAVAASTLIAAAAFQPLRRRVQHGVDRRFDRASYDAQRTIDAFASRLREHVDADRVRIDLLDTVSNAVHPAQASVWVAHA